MLHRSYAQHELSRALERYRALRCRRPRSTGASPTCAASTRRFAATAQTPDAAAPTMLDARRRRARRAYRERDQMSAARRDHVRAARRDHARLGSSSAATRSSPPTTRRVAARPARRRAEGRRPRAAALRPRRQPSTDGSLFWRLLVVAEAGSRFSLIEEYASRRRISKGYSTRRSSSSSSRREARVRLAAEPVAGDVALRHSPRARRARRRARLGRRRLRLEEGQGADPERPCRPGRHLARDRRLLRRRDAAPRLRHVPGAHRANTTSDFAFKGALRDTRRRCGAG